MSVADNFRLAPDRKIPAAALAAFLLQTAAVVYWAGSAAERLSVLERTLSNDQAAIERVAVLEEEVRAMKDALARIETKLDRVHP
ncbi:MAG TPA: hypothetical protein VG889_17390 [Rhizomicrobium sp.]|nr:hypothetical protein [Rhizomicrobium sp.]